MVLEDKGAPRAEGASSRSCGQGLRHEPQVTPGPESEMCWGCNCLVVVSLLSLQGVSSNSGIVCYGYAAEGRPYVIGGTGDPGGWRGERPN